MIPKWLYYLLNVTAYPLAIYLAIWLSNNVRYDPQGMAGGYQMLYYAMVAVVICFIVSLFASYKLVGIRVDKRVEEEGLDIYEHGESAYDL